MASPVHALAKVTSKGQVTLPAAVRRQLGIRTGDRIRFECKGRSAHVSVERGESPFARYAGIGTPGIGPGREAVLAWTRRLRDPDAP